MKKVMILFVLICFVFSGVIFADSFEEIEIEIESIEIENNEIENIEEEKKEVEKSLEEAIKELTEQFGKLEVPSSEQLQRPRRFKAVYGPHIKIMQLNLEEINNVITGGNNGFKPLDEILFLSGRQGSIGSRYGSRLGIYRVSGQVSSINPEASEYKKAVLAIDYNGFLYENGLFVGQKTDLAVGFSTGKGSTELKLLHDIPQEISGGIDNGLQSIFSRSFIYIEPRMTISRKLWAIIGAEVSFSYLLTHDLGEDWILDDYSVQGPAVQFNGPGIGLNLSFGF